MLASRPVFEIGPCDAMYESTELDCAKTEPTKTAKETQETRIFQRRRTESWFFGHYTVLLLYLVERPV